MVWLYRDIDRGLALGGRYFRRAGGRPAVAYGLWVSFLCTVVGLFLTAGHLYGLYWNIGVNLFDLIHRSFVQLLIEGQTRDTIYLSMGGLALLHWLVTFVAFSWAAGSKANSAPRRSR